VALEHDIVNLHKRRYLANSLRDIIKEANVELTLLVRSEYAMTSWLRPPVGLSLLAVARLPME
jgi:hypothetical protein